jgi:ribonucleoside-diphosphate reductase alpha chain
MIQLPTDYQNYIHLSRYARWSDELGRRETWEETVDRYFSFFQNRIEEQNPTKLKKILIDLKEIRKSVLNLEVMPSMRCLMTAGKALERDNVAGYNCSYVAVDHPHVFDEIMYILMCGTGVGFSVEKKYVGNLPTIANKHYTSNTTIVVEDSKIGWASAFRELIALLYTGKVPKWDMSLVRPAGSRLKTFGGRASGPEPLDALFKFSVDLFKKAAGRRLTTIEAFDLVCKIADIVVVGGVRRSALICLCDLEDLKMRDAKSGEWWVGFPHRRLANISAVYNEKPDTLVFLEEWQALYRSRSGERGIFNRQASEKQALKTNRREVSTTDGGKVSAIHFGTNPCSEIILRNKQFCNLSEVVIRPTDTFNDLVHKVRMATVLGTLQSTLTTFRYLSDTWVKNTIEERLLGVSLTGIMDHPFMSGTSKVLEGAENMKLAEVLQTLRETAIETNKEWAENLGIEPSKSITCVKPSGTVSQLVDAASGIHPRYAHHYIRRVRADKKDPVSKLMRDAGVPVEDDVMSPQQTDVFSFPLKAPETAILRDDVSALDQLKLWLTYQRNWCEHKPSITVYVQDNEWVEVAAFVYKYFDEMAGVSFLPYDNGTYRQAPYEEITAETFVAETEKMPVSIDWSAISIYEREDQTTNTKELACVSGVCEI